MTEGLPVAVVRIQHSAQDSSGLCIPDDCFLEVACQAQDACVLAHRNHSGADDCVRRTRRDYRHVQVEVSRFAAM